MNPDQKQANDVTASTVRALRDMSRLSPEDQRATAILLLAVVLDATVRDCRLRYVIDSVPAVIREAMASDLWSAVRGVLRKSPACG